MMIFVMLLDQGADLLELGVVCTPQQVEQQCLGCGERGPCVPHALQRDLAVVRSARSIAIAIIIAIVVILCCFR